MAKKFSVIKEDNKAANKTYDEYVINERWKKYRKPEYFEYRKKWEENPKDMVLGDFPLHLDIEITTFCNLGCPMCPRTIQIKNGEFGKIQHIDTELFKKLIEEGAKNGLASVKFNYLGEPLMHPDVIEMVKHCKSEGIIDVMFNTNGVLLDEKMSIGLLEAGIDGLFVSFDSSNKETYESIRIGAKFEDVYENVKKFHEIRNSDEKFFGTQIRISKIILPEESEKEMLEYIDMWKEHADVIGFGALIDMEKTGELPYNPKYRCDQPWQRLFVGTDGVVFACCLDNKKDYILGNAYTDNIKDIWKGKKLNTLRECHASGKYNGINMCRNCEYLCGISVKIEE